MERGELNISSADRIAGLDAETDAFSLEFSKNVFLAVLSGKMPPLFVFQEGNIDVSYFASNPSYGPAIASERESAKLR